MTPLLFRPATFLFLIVTVVSILAPLSRVQAGPNSREARYRTGFSEGYSAGYKSGFLDGWNRGRYQGQISRGGDAYLSGYADAYPKGYGNGYYDGRNRGKYFVPVIRW